MELFETRIRHNSEVFVCRVTRRTEHTLPQHTILLYHFIFFIYTRRECILHSSFASSAPPFPFQRPHPHIPMGKTQNPQFAHETAIEFLLLLRLHVCCTYLHVCRPGGRLQVLLQLLGVAHAEHEHLPHAVPCQELHRVVDHRDVHQRAQHL